MNYTVVMRYENVPESADFPAILELAAQAFEKKKTGAPDADGVKLTILIVQPEV